MTAYKDSYDNTRFYGKKLSSSEPFNLRFTCLVLSSYLTYVEEASKTMGTDHDVTTLYHNSTRGNDSRGSTAHVDSIISETTHRESSSKNHQPPTQLDKHSDRSSKTDRHSKYKGNDDKQRSTNNSSSQANRRSDGKSHDAQRNDSSHQSQSGQRNNSSGAPPFPGRRGGQHDAQDHPRQQGSYQ